MVCERSQASNTYGWLVNIDQAYIPLAEIYLLDVAQLTRETPL
jgi:hypothetical protein